jgi:hypothetical protein
VQVGDPDPCPPCACLRWTATRRTARPPADRQSEHRRPLSTKLGRVVEGYGILQPRVRVTMAGRRSLFARAAGPRHRPYPPVSDTYQDLFGGGGYRQGSVTWTPSAPRSRTACQDAMLSHVCSRSVRALRAGVG